MLTNENIEDILKTARGEGADVSEYDIAFLVLCDSIEDKDIAYDLAYNEGGVHPERGIGEVYLTNPNIKALARAAKPFGVGAKDNKTITSEENMNAMVKMLDQIDNLMLTGGTPDPDLIKLAADIRFKVQAKFDLQQDADEGKHIIVVPQKHDMICPHTNRECTQMPSKEACCKFYNLKEEE